ncbi:O-antigen ligase family protein [Candidatus Wolfebacteria bacterium]|nr:O-antigen ligase family protein [Candidatus Wolfebacteria bacterium]
MERADIISRLPGLLAALFAAILPFVTSQHLFYGSINAKYFFVVGFVSLAGLFLAYLLLRGHHTVPLRRRVLLWMLAALLAIHYLAAFFGIYPAGSLWSDIPRSTGVFFLTYVGFLAFWASEVLTKRDWSFVWRAVAVSTGVFALLSFFGIEGLGITGRFLVLDFAKEGLTFGNSTFVGAYLLLGFILTLVVLVQSEKGSKMRWFFGALAVIQFCSPLFFGHMLWVGWSSVVDALHNPALLLGAARASGATVFVVVVYLVGSWLIRRFVRADITRRYVTFGWRGVWVVGMLVAIVLLFVPGSFVQERYIGESTAARIIVWKNGLTSIRERPVLGWGPETFRFVHERYFDNRLYLEENFGEVWFDRAHNIVVDTLVSVGVLGALTYIVLVGFFLRVVARVGRRGLVGDTEAELLYILPFAHFLQLQTSFDTVATYALGGLILGYALFLERRMAVVSSGEGEAAASEALPGVWQKVAGATLLVVILIGSIFLLFAEYSRQNALYALSVTKVTRNTDRRVALIDRAFAGPPRFEPLRLASIAFIKSGQAQFTQTPSSEKPVLTRVILTELDAYERHYERYLSRLPEHYRARMVYAYLLLAREAFGGENKLAETKTLIADSYRLSPDNPITYALDALATLYGGDVAGAKEKVNEALALNPDLPFTNMIREHIDKVAEQFPVPGLESL